MIVCPTCQHHNPENAEDCSSCGSSLAGFVHRVCPVCGALNPAQNAFCQRCFGELGSQQDESEAQATVTPYEPPERPVVTRESVRDREGHGSPSRAEDDLDPPSGLTESSDEDEEFVLAERIVESTLIQDLVASSLLARETPDGPDQDADSVSTPPDSDPDDSLSTSPPQGAMPDDDTLGENESLYNPEGTTAEPHDLAIPGGNPLEGIESPLPIEASMTLPHRATAPAHIQAIETDRYDAALFGQIASERASLREAKHTVAQRKTQILPRWGRMILYLLVILAALVPRFTGTQTAAWIQPRGSVADTARSMGALDGENIVLVAVDYAPTYAGELDPLALALLRHLSSQGARTVAMTTETSGIGIANRLYRQVAKETSGYSYGDQYAILGYLPGHHVAMRALNMPLAQAFGTDHVTHRTLAELPVTQELVTVRDFDRVVILADDATVVRQWIEQVGGQDGVPLHALVSAKAEPALVPYYQSGQLSSLVAGTIGAAEYEVAVGGARHATRAMDAYAALFLVVLLTAGVSNMLYISGRDRRTQGHS